MKRWTDRIAHDLKGPLAPLQTATFLLKSSEVGPERQRELIEVIERQARRLNRMIEELGDFNRADQQRLVTERRPCMLALVLDLAIGSVPGLATDPRFAPGLEMAEVDGEEARLVQLFHALLVHLAARDPAGTPELRVEPVGAGVRVVLADRGPDLAPAALAALFEAPMPTPHDDGLGLRLMIAAAIAQAHGGALRAQAREGGGLRFECELPFVARA
jgi:signal transduction histidine kinase